MSAVVQRWREKRTSYRPAGEVIDTRAHEVVALPDDTTPKAFVTAHHYSGTFPAARWRFGLYGGAGLVGVAVFSHPSNDKVLTNVFPVPAIEAVELGRFVLLDTVPGNGETWFLARCFELLRRENLFGVVSFSDPVARTSLSGSQVFPGHIGTIYQAFNARYRGRSSPSTLRLLPDGTSFSNRAAGKICRSESGLRYSVEHLRRWGAPELTGDPKEWLRLWRSRLTRPLRHHGNHRYVWALSKRNWRHLPPSLPYPKAVIA